MKLFLILAAMTILEHTSFQELNDSKEKSEILFTGYGISQDDTTFISKEKDAELSAIGAALKEAMTTIMGFHLSQDDEVNRITSEGKLNNFFVQSITEIKKADLTTFKDEIKIVTPSNIHFTIYNGCLVSISNKDYDKILQDLREAKIEIVETTPLDKNSKKVVLSFPIAMMKEYMKKTTEKGEPENTERKN